MSPNMSISRLSMIVLLYVAVLRFGSPFSCHFVKKSLPFQVSRSISSSSCSTRRHNSMSLRSLQQLMEDITMSETPSSSTRSSPRTIFVGGKGGVGKTTVSSALAVTLSSYYNTNSDDSDKKVLIVSTDPAHSLGDALDVDLRRMGQGKPVLMTDPITGGRLYACEVDAGRALDEFRQNLQAFDINRLADALGVSTELLSSLGLQELSSLLNNPPPGLDELVALSSVLDRNSVGNTEDDYFDIIVVDTAPTGHTLRLLALPQFVDGLLGKLIQLRMKLSGIASTLQAFLGNDQANQRAKAIDDAVNRLETFRIKMGRLRTTLQDAQQTRFVVVTIPTQLGVAETKRLVSELNTQGVRVSDIVVNQCVDSVVAPQQHQSASPTDENDASLLQYYNRRKAGQEKWIRALQDTVEKVSASKTYKNNGNYPGIPISITQVPFFDVELVGVPALGYVGSLIYRSNPSFNHLMDMDSPNHDNNNNNNKPRVVICGGKGGVGKTTTSASLAVTMACAGHNVALISTDPAHSLGDAIDMNLKGGNLQECALIGVPNNVGTGSLSVLEIDPTMALGQFKGIVDQLIGSDAGSAGPAAGLADTLRDLQEVFDTLPAGTDEVVALARIVKIVREGKFDRIVLDTAPTGHTLRMLSTPGFLADLIDRLLTIADKVNSNTMIKMFLSATANNVVGRNKDVNVETAAASAKSALLSFQFQMYDLEDMFSDAERTEFVIVTIPTELAVRESTRLLNDLTYESPEMPIKVRNVIVNQVLGTPGNTISGNDLLEEAKLFVSHLEKTQKRSMDELQRFVNEPTKRNIKNSNHNNNYDRLTVTPVRYLDTEPRGVFGLKVMGDELLRPDPITSSTMSAV